MTLIKLNEMAVNLKTQDYKKSLRNPNTCTKKFAKEKDQLVHVCK